MQFFALTAENHYSQPKPTFLFFNQPLIVNQRAPAFRFFLDALISQKRKEVNNV